MWAVLIRLMRLEMALVILHGAHASLPVCGSRCKSPHSESRGATRTWDCAPQPGDWDAPWCEPSGLCKMDRANQECEAGYHNSTLCPPASSGLARDDACNDGCMTCTSRSECAYYCEGIDTWETASGVVCNGEREANHFCPRPQHEIDARLANWFLAAIGLLAGGWLLPILLYLLKQRFFPSINLAQLVQSVPEVAALAAARMQHRVQDDVLEETSRQPSRRRTIFGSFRLRSQISRSGSRSVSTALRGERSGSAEALLAEAVLARQRLRLRTYFIAQLGWMLAWLGVLPATLYNNDVNLASHIGHPVVWMSLIPPGLALFALALRPVDVAEINLACSLLTLTYAGLTIFLAIAASHQRWVSRAHCARPLHGLCALFSPWRECTVCGAGGSTRATPSSGSAHGSSRSGRVSAQCCSPSPA